MKVFVIGPIDTLSGYGARCRDFTRELIKHKPDWEITIVKTPWGDCPSNFLKEGIDDDLLKLIHTTGKMNRADISFQITVPSLFNKTVADYNVLVTAGIEMDKCTIGWIDKMNEANLVITSSNFSRFVLKHTTYKTNNGTTSTKTPIEVLFEGSDVDVYKMIDVDSNSSVAIQMNKIPQDFCYLGVGHWTQGDFGHDRKDMGTMVMEFSKFIKENNLIDKIGLVLKTSGANFSSIDYENIKTKIQKIQQSVFGNVDVKPFIHIMYGDLSDKEMNELYNHDKIKVLITTTHGEGYGRPIQEFTFVGKPVIASAWSGHIDFLSKTYSVLIQGGLVNVEKSFTNGKSDLFPEDAKWFAINPVLLQRVLRSVYNNYKTYLDKAKEYYPIVRETKSIDMMGNALDFILSKYKDKFPPETIEIQIPDLDF